MTSKEQSLVGECKMFPRNDNFVGIVLLINDRCLGGGIFFFFCKSRGIKEEYQRY